MGRIYQENPKDTWSHNGIVYSINEIFKIVHEKVTFYIDVSSLQEPVSRSFVTKNGVSVCGSCFGQMGTTNDAKDKHTVRVEESDVTIPIVVVNGEDQTYVVDGIHRVQKAVGHGIVCIPAKMISKMELEMARVE